MKKRFKNRKDLIKAAIANTEPPLTEQEELCRNILMLSGIKNPSKVLIKIAMKEAIKKIYKGAVKK